jgi:hypothetical protein
METKPKLSFVPTDLPFNGDMVEYFETIVLREEGDMLVEAHIQLNPDFPMTPRQARLDLAKRYYREGSMDKRGVLRSLGVRL